MRSCGCSPRSVPLTSAETRTPELQATIDDASDARAALRAAVRVQAAIKPTVGPTIVAAAGGFPPRPAPARLRFMPAAIGTER